MSDPLYVAVVAEGLTDRVVIDAALQSILGERSYVLRRLVPEQSVAFAGPTHFGPLGGGWGAVYKWCRQAQERAGGKLGDDELFRSYGLLIIHVDADVAGKSYADLGGEIERTEQARAKGPDLPCEQPCPPPEASTERLREVVLRWAGETQVPARTVLCIPSKSTEAWVVKVLSPQDGQLTRTGWECHPSPESRLATLPKKQRISKSESDYLKHKKDITAAWPGVAASLSSARRFDQDVRGAVT